jgi:DNA-binding transcriptional LysR family regulator
MVRHPDSIAGLKMRFHATALIYFDAVRRNGSVREAARALHVAPSAISRQLSSLEERLDAPLFERLSGGLRLTSAGESLARHVTHVLQDMDRTLEELDRQKGLQSGRAGLMTAESLCADLLPAALETFHARHPQVSVQVRTAGSQPIPAAIAQGEADIGLAFALYRHPELHQVAVGRFRLGAVVAPGHRLSVRKSVSLGTLSQERLIVATPDLAIRQLLDPHIARLGADFRPVVELSSVELARQLVLRGQGVTFLTRIGIERELAQKRLVFVPLNANGPVMSHLGVYVRLGRMLPPAVDALARVLAEEIQRRERDD